MKILDIDGLFDEKLGEYIEQNKGKYTEKQWENIIPKLYKKFGDTYVAKIKCTPKEYYGKMSDGDLIQTLAAHLEQDVPVPEFLCAEIEARAPVEALLPLLESKDEETVSYAINLIGADPRAFSAYYEIITKTAHEKDIKDEVIDKLKENADAATADALRYYRGGVEKEAMLEIMSRAKKARSEEIFQILLDAFLYETESLIMHASYLAAYGDERALPYLLNRIEDQSIGFVEFQELKYAIETLGGEYNEPRDFSEDKDFIRIGDGSVPTEDLFKN